MALISHGATRSRFTEMAKKKPIAGPQKRTAYDPKHSYLKSKVADTNFDAPQFKGEDRAMTATEKRTYAYKKNLDDKKALASESKQQKKARKADKKKEMNMSDTETQGVMRKAFRERYKNATTKIRKPGEGLYLARKATAEDLDKGGKLPTKDVAWKAATYKRLSK